MRHKTKPYNLLNSYLLPCNPIPLSLVETLIHSMLKYWGNLILCWKIPFLSIRVRVVGSCLAECLLCLSEIIYWPLECLTVVHSKKTLTGYIHFILKELLFNCVFSHVFSKVANDLPVCCYVHLIDIIFYFLCNHTIRRISLSHVYSLINTIYSLYLLYFKKYFFSYFKKCNSD